MTPDALSIRDAAVERLRAIPAIKSIRLNTATQVEPKDLPAALVMVAREDMTADGDDNAGEPSYVHDITLAFEVAVTAPTRDGLDDRLAQIMASIVGKLLTDPTFLALLESIPSISSRPVYPKDGEAYFAIERTEMTVRFRSDWSPVPADAFAGASVSVRPATSPSAPAITGAWDV